MIPRIGIKAISEVAQMPGYIFGALAYGASAINGDPDFGKIVDNAWIQAIQGLEESVKDALPVYSRDVIKNGNIWDNIFSAEFWGSEGADGLGFLLAFFAPGTALRFTNLAPKIAKLINGKSEEIYFTGGGTEADNWAIKGVAETLSSKGKHIITSKIEHHAVLHTCEYLEKKGYDITYLDVDEYGMIDLEELKKVIREDTILISIMFANNEVGTIQPVLEIGKIAKDNNVLFHTDAVQALGAVTIDVNEMNIDL